MLFFSNNDNCSGIAGSQAHPDWIQGQANSSRNSDGSPTHGFAYNTGSVVSGEISWGFHRDARALSGDCVLKMGVADAYNNRRAVRIFRRYDRNGRSLPDDAYYSAWFYFPQKVTHDARATIDGSTTYGYWNVFQIKNKVNGNSLANLSVNAGAVTGGGAMKFDIWRKSACGAVEECSAAATIDPLIDKPIPVGQWVHLEMFLRARTGNDGRVVLWQDGEKILDFTGSTKRTGTERQAWSVNNYGILHRPSSHTLLVDDALISTTAIHPALFD